MTFDDACKALYHVEPVAIRHVDMDWVTGRLFEANALRRSVRVKFDRVSWDQWIDPAKITLA